MPSVTFAVKAKKALSRIGIRSELVKVDASRTVRGCTHGIMLSEDDYYNAIFELRSAGIEYSVYPSQG